MVSVIILYHSNYGRVLKYIVKFAKYISILADVTDSFCRDRIAATRLLHLIAADSFRRNRFALPRPFHSAATVSLCRDQFAPPRPFHSTATVSLCRDRFTLPRPFHSAATVSLCRDRFALPRAVHSVISNGSSAVTPNSPAVRFTGKLSSRSLNSATASL